MTTIPTRLAPQQVPTRVLPQVVGTRVNAQTVPTRLPITAVTVEPPTGYGFGLGPFGGPDNPFGGTP